MRLGVVVRADDRGLAHLTQEFARHMRPERVLVVDVADPRFPFRMLSDDLLGTEATFFATFEGGLFNGPIIEFLKGLTHVYTAETPYAPDFFERARAMGVASVCHVMPEFDRFTGERPALRPSAVWLPTRWRADLVEHSAIVPIPAPVAPRPRIREYARTFVHIIGSHARPDRQGTLAVYDAIREGPRDVHWLLFAQDVRRGVPAQLRGCRNVTMQTGSVVDRWSLYDEADVMVAPRRWGGLSLPVMEACASGVPVITLDSDPMADAFASARVQSRYAGQFDAPGGKVEIHEADRHALVAAIIDFAKGGVDVRQESADALLAAEFYGWPGAVDLYWEALERVTL